MMTNDDGIWYYDLLLYIYYFTRFIIAKASGGG